jgi:hypothetical protein
MELLIAAGIYALIALISFACRDRTVTGVQVSLCLTCVNAVVTRGTRGEESIACNYAGAMRPVKFTVCECTGYSGREGRCKLVTIEGFARESREVYAEVTIS